MRSNIIWPTVLVVLFLSVACSENDTGGSRRDGSQAANIEKDGTIIDAGDARAADGVADGGLAPPCFDPAEVSACESSGSGPAELFNATTLGNGAHFVAIGGWAALGERNTAGADRWFIVYVIPPNLGEKGPVSTAVLNIEWPEANGDYRVLDVQGGASARNDPSVDVRALACAGDKCAILGANSRSGEPLRPLPGLELPAGTSVDHLVTGVEWVSVPLDGGVDTRPEGRVCVFGDGLLCHDGKQWVTEIAPGSAPRLRDVAVEDIGVAVGEAGAMFVRPWFSSARWQSFNVGASETLIAVDADNTNQRYTVIGKEGFWYEHERGFVVQKGRTWYEEAAARCRQSPALIAAVSSSIAPLCRSIALDKNGNIYLRIPKGNSLVWCKRSALNTAPILGYSYVPCSNDNFLVLTNDGIFGFSNDASSVLACGEVP